MAIAVNSHYLSSILALIHTPATTFLAHCPRRRSCREQDESAAGATDAAASAELVFSSMLHGAESRCWSHQPAGAAAAGVAAVNEPAEGRAANAGRRSQDAVQAEAGRGEPRTPEDPEIRVESHPKQMRYA
jgi:hypothetical protein